MSERLPPLTALRAFEAAARHLSFAKAAHELNVTPAALSFQIKSLEKDLGAPVFHRLVRAVELTEHGRALAPGLSNGFSQVNRAWRNTKRMLASNVLTVTAGPSFTAKWLAPRLFSFATANPDLELRFVASLRIMDFERDEIDIAIRFGYGSDDGLASMKIHEDWVAPMMTPALAATYTSLESLRNAPLIHDDSVAFLNPAPSWPTWFKAAGLAPVEEHGPRFSQADHALDLALEGAGVVLGRSSMADRALSDGRLVAPFRPALRTGGMYRLVFPPANEGREAIRRFSDWVIEEIEGLEERTKDVAPIKIQA